jgi:outer membrane receptor protein involved in Fe transport
MAGAGISVPVWSQRLFLTPEVQYIAPRKTKTDRRIDGSAVTNLTLATGTLYDHFEAAFSIYNVFDEDTYCPAGRELFQDRVPLEGRTFRVQGSYKF